MALTFLAYLILLVVDSFALFWCGLWNSLRARHVNRAIGATLFHVLIVPWILFLGFIIVITVNPNIVHYFENVPLFIAIMWFSIGLGYPLWLISSCRRLLNNQLRLLASTKPGLEKAGS